MSTQNKQHQASDKMVLYAKAIAKNLNIDEPNFNDYNETKSFIDKNKNANNKVSSYNPIGALVDKLQFIKEKYSIIFDLGCIDTELMSNDMPKIIAMWDNNKLVDLKYEQLSRFQDMCIDECLSKKGIINFNYISVISFETCIDGEITNRLLRVEYANELENSEQETSIQYTSSINIYDLKKFEFVKHSNKLHKEYVGAYNPTWNKEYQEYLSSKEWNEISNNFKSIMKKCLLCHNSGNLIVHHLSYDNVDFKNIGSEFISDTAVICSDCHGKIHLHDEINFDGHVIPQSNIRLRELTNPSKILDIINFVSCVVKK